MNARHDVSAAESPIAVRIAQTHGVAAALLFAQILASALLLRAAVPPNGVAAAAWFALVPLLLAIRGKSPGNAALVGFAFGVASLAAMHTWFLELPGANIWNASALFGYLAIYPAIWCAALSLLRGRDLPWILPGAVLWVLLDWGRSHAGFLALPWDALSHSQVVDLPLLQLAAFGGAPAIAFVVCLANLAFARAVELRSARPLAAPLALLVAAHALGFVHLQSAPSGGDLRVALIQPAADGAPPAERLRTLLELTARAARTNSGLIVWPESEVSGFAGSPPVIARLAATARAAKAALVFGSADFGKYAQEAGGRAGQIRFKNQAFMMLPDGTVRGPVTKNRLVPFAEYMPLGDRVEWPHWLIARQLHGIAGKNPEIFTLGDGTRIGVSICWESLFSELAGRLVRHGASMIVQLSNDSDFGVSAEPAQHNAASVLRAVEYARPVFVASSSGPSMLIDAHGRVVDSLDSIGTAGWIARTVSLSGTTTAYQRFGMWWLVLLSAAALTDLVRRCAIHRRRS